MVCLCVSTLLSACALAPEERGGQVVEGWVGPWVGVAMQALSCLQALGVAGGG